MQMDDGKNMAARNEGMFAPLLILNALVKIYM